MKIIARFLQETKYQLIKLSTIGLDSIIFPLIIFFTPLKGILITVAAFIILDTISGIWKSKINKVPITSRAMSGVVSKMVLYQLAVLTAYLLDYYILGDILLKTFGIEQIVVKVIALLLIFIECQSINENYKIAKGIDLWKEFKKLLGRVKEVTTEVTGIHKDLDGMRVSPHKEKPDLGDVFKDE